MPNPKTVPGPVRAWVCGPLIERDPIICGSGPRAWRRFSLCTEEVMEVLIIDPRTHRAVPIKRKGRK